MFFRWTQVVEGIKDTTYTVTNLSRGQEVKFRVCAENSMGLSDATEGEYITIQAPIKPEAPIVKQPLEDVCIGLGKELTMTCVIIGTPTPEIKWQVVFISSSFFSFDPDLNLSCASLNINIGSRIVSC